MDNIINFYILERKFINVDSTVDPRKKERSCMTCTLVEFFLRTAPKGDATKLSKGGGVSPGPSYPAFYDMCLYSFRYLVMIVYTRWPIIRHCRPLWALVANIYTLRNIIYDKVYQFFIKMVCQVGFTIF